MALLIIPVLKWWSRARGPYGYLRTWNRPITAREISQPYNNRSYVPLTVLSTSVVVDQNLKKISVLNFLMKTSKYPTYRVLLWWEFGISWHLGVWYPRKFWGTEMSMASLHLHVLSIKSIFWDNIKGIALKSRARLFKVRLVLILD